MASENIDIRVREDGSRVVRRNIEDIGGSAERAAAGIDLLKRALLGIGVGAAVKEFFKLADAFTNIQNKLRTVTDSVAQMNVVNKELFRIANQTRQAYEGTVSVFTRMAGATKALGISQRELLDFQTSLNQSVALSGATAEEAEKALIQLAQGMGAGALRGDELNSVMEQLPTVADVIAKQLGVTRGQLKELAQDGKLTTKVIIDGFKNAREEIARNFAKAVPTVGQAFVVLRNNLLKVIGDFDKATGLSEALSRSILFLADHMEITAKVAGIAGAALLAAYGGPLIVTSITRLIGLVNALTVAMLRNPFTALATLALTAAVALYEFKDSIALVNGELATLGDFFSAVGEQVGPLLSAAFESLTTAMGSAGQALKQFVANLNVQDIILGIAQSIDYVIASLNGLAAAVPVAFANLPAALADLGVQAANAILFAIRDGFIALGQWIGQAGTAISQYFTNSFVTDLQSLPGRVTQVFTMLYQGLLTVNQAIITGVKALWAALPAWLKDIIIQALNGMISAFESGINTIAVAIQKIPEFLIKAVSNGVKAAIDLFNSLVTALQNLPAAIGEIFRAAMEAAKAKVIEGINVIIGYFNMIPGIDLPGLTASAGKQTAAALGSLGNAVDGVVKKYTKLNEEGKRIVTLPRITNDYAGEAAKAMKSVTDTLKNGFNNDNAGAAAELGKKVRGAYDKAFQESGTPVEDWTKQMLDRANQIARDRKEAAANETPVDLNATSPALNLPGTGGGGGGGGRKGRGGGGGGGSGNSYGELLSQMEREGELLQLNNRERQIRAEVMRFEDQLGRSLTESERAQVEQLATQNQLYEKQAEILDNIRGPKEELKADIEALNSLYDQGKISLQEYTEEMRNLQVELTGLDNSFFGGIQNGFARVAQWANEAGSSISDWIVGAFDSATDAIVNFAKTGEFNFRNFVHNIAADLLRLSTRQLFAGFANMLMGTGGGIGGLFGGGLGKLFGFATGGDFVVGGAGGTDSQVVAMRATPGERIAVQTPTQTRKGTNAATEGEGGGGAAPQVNQRIINVLDPELVGQYLNTPEGETVLINVIRSSGILNRNAA